MHLEARGEEASNRGEERAESYAHHKGQHDTRNERHAGEVEDVAKDRTRVNTLVHDDRRCRHAHTHHATNGEVGAGKQDESGNAQRQEHARRGLLEDVQYVLVREKLRALHDGRDGAQEDEDKENDDVEAVLEEELPAVEGVLVVLPLLGLTLRKRELGHTQEVDEVILVAEGRMLAILDLLHLLLKDHLGVEAPVLVDVVLVLDLGAIGETREVRAVLVLERLEVGLVAILGKHALLGTALTHGFEVLLCVVLFEVAFGLRDKAGHLDLVARLDSLCGGKLALVAGNGLLALLLGEDAVALGCVDVTLELNHAVGSVAPQLVDLCLDGGNALVNGAEQGLLLLDRKHLIALVCHVCSSPLQVLRA